MLVLRKKTSLLCLLLFYFSFHPEVTAVTMPEVDFSKLIKEKKAGFHQILSERPD